MRAFEALRDGSHARRPSDYVSARAGVTVHEEITVPAGANIVVLSGSGSFWAAFGVNPVAAVPADDDAGASCELVNPATPLDGRTFIVTPGEKISVVASASTAVTASFYE